MINMQLQFATISIYKHMYINMYMHALVDGQVDICIHNAHAYVYAYNINEQTSTCA